MHFPKSQIIRPVSVQRILCAAMVFWAAAGFGSSEIDRMAMRIWDYTFVRLRLSAQSDALRPFMDSQAQVGEGTPLDASPENRPSDTQIRLARHYFRHLRELLARTPESKRGLLERALKDVRIHAQNSRESAAHVWLPSGYISISHDLVGKISTLILLVHEQIHVEQWVRIGRIPMKLLTQFAPWTFERSLEYEAALAHTKFVLELSETPEARRQLLALIGEESLTPDSTEILQEFAEHSVFDPKTPGVLKVNAPGRSLEEQREVIESLPSVAGFILQIVAHGNAVSAAQRHTALYPGPPAIALRTAALIAAPTACYLLIRYFAN